MCLWRIRPPSSFFLCEPVGQTARHVIMLNMQHSLTDKPSNLLPKPLPQKRFPNLINRNHPLIKQLQPHIGETFQTIWDLNPHNLPTNTANIQTGKFNKGTLGNLIQTNLYNIPLNNDPNPDFADFNIELKLTPIVTRQNIHNPKERLIANIINYHDYGALTPLQHTPFWRKTQHTLTIFYQPHPNLLQSTIIDGFIINFNHHPSLHIIKNDYSIIVNKIISGEAHIISGRDTQFLEAATKGAGHGKDMRTQPHSDIPAKQRAFAFKTAFMRTITQHIKPV